MPKGISLDKLAKGALKAQVNREFNKVAANIWDPNTSPTAKRTINITITIRPDEERELGDTEISVKSTLCPVKSASTKLILGYDQSKGIGVTSELNAEMLGQIDFEELEERAAQEQQEESNNVIDLRTQNL